MLNLRLGPCTNSLPRLAPENSAARAEYAAKSLDPRTKLAPVRGYHAWVEANK